ncbi:MAG TPA: class I SAM-dependent methyltransferase [Kofleriaceae bacterium]|nr:class I SAM-dependent methyltransferase [Kofleriaceae bacterium]
MKPPIYDRSIATHYDLASSSVTYDIEFWKGLASECVYPDGHALELGCGTLRVLIPVAQAGVRVTGIDNSPDMLELGREKLAACPPEVQERVTLVEGDVRSLAFDDGRFNFIYMPFNTLPMVPALADQLALFAAVREHLAPGGRFALDVIVPDLERMGQKNLWQLVADTSDPATGRRYQRDARYDIDLGSQMMRAVYRRRLYQDNLLVEETLVDFEAALIFPREIEHLVARSGLVIEQLWGDFARTDFRALRNPRFLVLVARAA